MYEDIKKSIFWQRLDPAKREKLEEIIRTKEKIAELKAWLKIKKRQGR